ncbi:DUF551 domain-containing protein [Klebsiella pneumoniae]
MTSKFTREELLNIIDTDHVQCGEASALARMALAAIDSEPVAWTWHYREQWHVTNDERRAEFVAKDGDVAVLPLYRHAQPAPAVPEDFDFNRFNDVVWLECVASNPHMHSPTTSAIARVALELNKRSATMEAEPDRNPVLAYADSYRDMSKQGVESVPIWSVITDLERNIAPLYRHAQPATVVPVVPVENHIGSKNALDAIVSFIKGKSNPTVKCYEEVSEQLFKDNCHGIHSHVIEYILKLGEELEDLRAEQAEMQPVPVVPVCTCRSGDGSLRWPCPVHPGSSPVIPDTWIPVSERMPEDEQEVLTINKMGHRFVSFFDKHSGLFFDRLDAPVACCIEHVLVTHWMPLPAAPQEVKGE